MLFVLFSDKNYYLSHHNPTSFLSVSDIGMEKEEGSHRVVNKEGIAHSYVVIKLKKYMLFI